MRRAMQYDEAWDEFYMADYTFECCVEEMHTLTPEDPLRAAYKEAVDDARRFRKAALRRARRAPHIETTVTPEDTLRAAGIDDARQAEYQRKMSILLATQRA